MLRRGGKNIQMKYTKKILMTQITMMAHLEPDILECEVKWVFGSTAANKASGGDGISAKLFN